MTFPILGTKTILRLFSLSFLLFAMLPATTLYSQVYMKSLGTRGSEISLEMTPTSDGNYVTVGPVTRPPGGPPGFDIYLNKVSPGGNLIWTRQILESNVQGFGNAVPVSVTETFSAGVSSGFAVTGIVRNGISVDDPVMVVTTDVVGIPTGYSSYGGPLPINNVGIISGAGVKIIQIPDGRLAICGSVTLANSAGQLPFILVVQQDLTLDFMRVYEDAAFSIPGANLFGFNTRAHFADIEYVEELIHPDGTALQEAGFMVVGSTGPMNSYFSEILVMRTKIDGNPSQVTLHGPQQVKSIGTALTITQAGNVEVAGLVIPSPSLTGAPAIPPSTLVLKLEPHFLGTLDQDEYHGFIIHSDIREVGAGEFIMAGRDAIPAISPDGKLIWNGAVLRIKNSGTVVFANGYGSPNGVEVFTDVHEMAGGDLLSSGISTVWCRGPMDEYLNRTLSDGSIVGCYFYSLNYSHTEPVYPVRDTWLPSELLDLVRDHDHLLSTPNTIVYLICPQVFLPNIVLPIPWDWFRRADFTRDLQIDIGDAIASLGRLFGGGQPSVPEQAADSNNDGTHDVSDVIHTLNYLFGGGSPPVAPFDEPGPDPENDQGNIFNIDELLQWIDQSLLAEGKILAQE